MIDLLLDILMRLPLLAQEFGPRERWDGLRRAVPAPMDGPRIVSIILIIAVGLVVMVVAISVSRALARQKRSRSQFVAQGQRLGLNSEEQNILAWVGRMAKVRNLESVMTMQSAFERGVAGVWRSDRMQSLQPAVQKKVEAMIVSVREKLGFQAPVSKAAQESQASSRQIAAGSRLSIVRRESYEKVHAVVKTCNDDALVVQPDIPFECVEGESCLVRYSNAGTVWEFDATIMASKDQSVMLRHTNTIRFINRRQFPRVATSRPAQVCSFPFVKSGPRAQALDLVESMLVEIAGPGLLIDTPLKIAANDRILVMVKLSAEKVIEGIGRVRRVAAGADGLNQLAVELVGLNPSEVNELARETNAAAIENKAQAAKARQPQPAMAQA